jgi:glycosyltransferase involved in cell wall biosynthesis
MNGMDRKTVLVLAFAKGRNGTTTHQQSFRNLCALIPEYEFIFLNHPRQLDIQYDLYLNLVPPYNVYNQYNLEARDFYEQATGWVAERQWRLVRGLYHLLPKGVRQKLVPVKFRFLKSYLRVLPPATEWATLCHDLTPVICKDWFEYPPEDRIDFLSNYKKARQVVAVSEATRLDLARHGVGEKKVSVVYNSYDESFNLNDQGKKPPVSDYLLVVGSFEPRKNAKNVYEAFLKIKSRYPGKLVFVGSDKWGNRSVYKSIQRDPRCLIVKHVSKKELIGWYRGARALVYASLYEGFGLPVLEAIGCGIPVVCSGNSGMLEVGEGYAEFVNPLNPEDITEKILKTLTPEYRVNFGSRERLLEKFSVKENAKRLKNILDNISEGQLESETVSDGQALIPV